MSNSINVLLIEDNKGDALLAKEAFKDCPILRSLDVVEDGELAISYLRKLDQFTNAVLPDLILLDLNLPKKDGREVLEEIKQDAVLKRIPVIVLTTSESDKDILHAYDSHANCYIRKPVNLKEFIAVVKRIEEFWFTIVKFPRH